jgi:hypothetical protein
MREISGTPSVQGIVKFLHLTEIINTQVLLSQEEDQIIGGCQRRATHGEISILNPVCSMAESPLWISIWRGWGDFEV